MSHHWVIITFSWLGTASLQYINTGGPGADTVLDSFDPTLQYPLPYVNYFNLPIARNEFEAIPDGNENQYNLHEAEEVQRKRRTVDDKEVTMDKHWLPNLVDTDKTLYLRNEEKAVNPFVVGYSGVIEDNGTEFLGPQAPLEKKNFSPWGGKRDKANIEQMWTWKRASAIREPSMPKRVRFSPWGGKRSGQMIYKPGSKGSKIIYSTSIPELTRIISNYSPTGKRLDLAGFQFIPSIDKRHPIKILALSTNMDERTIPEALPFKTFVESLPKMFRHGHPYVDVDLRKDSKRKVKFSAWGGKRSPPIIGPIWTPASQNVKDSTLDTILLIRNSQDKDDTTKAL